MRPAGTRLVSRALLRVGTDGRWEFWHRLADLKKDQMKSVAVAKPGLGSSTHTLIPRVHEVRRAQLARFPDEQEKVFFFFPFSVLADCGWNKTWPTFPRESSLLQSGPLKSL